MAPEPEQLVEDPIAFGKDEMNFAEFPIALLTDRVPKGQTIIKFEDEVYDEKRKKLVPRRRIIEGSQEYGLPTATDDAVILALIQVTKLKNNFQSRVVEFTQLELIKMLGWTNEGHSYERLKKSLLRIKNVNYNYDNAWYDPRQKTWTTKAFSIIDLVEINDGRSQGGLFPSRFTWGEIVFQSFQAGFIRSIDFQLCMRLEHPTALRMYRFLGKRFHNRPEWTFNLKEFAHEHIGLGRNYEGGTQISRKLKPAIEELEKVGFLEPLKENERFIKKGREWSVRFIQRTPALDITALLPDAEAGEIDAPPPPPPALSLPPLVAALVQRGVTKTKAAKLVKENLELTIQAKIGVFDWLVKKQDKRVSANPAGYLVKSIEDDYAAPKGYNTQSDQAAADEQAAQARRKEREEEARQQTEQDIIASYWESLSEEQKADVDAKSKAATDPRDLRHESESSNLPITAKRVFQRNRREKYLRQLLQAIGKLPADA